MTIRHISLDFWNTVGKPNPEYSAARAELLAVVFDVDASLAKQTYTSVKGELDRAAECFGTDNGRLENINTLYRAFGIVNHHGDWLGKCFDHLFYQYPPIVDERIIQACNRAAQKGISLSIASNTNFILGGVISSCLRDIPFSFMLFSDEIGVSKPHTEFFDRIVSSVRLCNPRATRHEDVIHIGDHAVCDGAAKHHGMQFSLVNNLNTASIINQVLDDL